MTFTLPEDDDYEMNANMLYIVELSYRAGGLVMEKYDVRSPHGGGLPEVDYDGSM